MNKSSKKRIVQQYCEECGHDKAFNNDSGRVKCSRCGHVQKEGLL